MSLALEVCFQSSTAVRPVAGAARAIVGLVSCAVGQLVLVDAFSVFGRTISVGSEGEIGHRGCVLWKELMGLSGCGGITRQKAIVLRRRRVHQIQFVVLWLVGGG